jgi:predicted 2-oxoglutarate/Fe(II)-dependent dioxygenase YbiX
MKLHKKSIPFNHIILNEVFSDEIFSDLCKGLAGLHWNEAKSEEYLKDNSTEDSTLKFITSNKNLRRAFQNLESAEFLSIISRELSVKITKIDSIVFLRMISGFFNHVHSDENDFGEKVRLIIYVSSADSYQGGELILHDNQGNEELQTYKLDSNTMFGFKMGGASYHSVRKIESGERVCLALTYK